MNSTPTTVAPMLPPLEAVLCTEELNRRPSRPPDYERENRALVSLAQSLADSPHTILQTLANTILKVFECDAAGVSLVTEDGMRFYWPAIAGVWKPHRGGGTPRDFGPCGDVLDRRARGRAGGYSGTGSGRGLERRRQHRRRYLPAGARSRWPRDIRPTFGMPGH